MPGWRRHAGPDPRDVEQMCGSGLHRFTIEIMVFLAAFDPSHLSGRQPHASFADYLLAIVVVDDARQMPSARLIVGPAHAFMHPGLEVIGIEPSQFETVLGSRALPRRYLDLRFHDWHPHRLRRALGRSHEARKAPAEIV